MREASVCDNCQSAHLTDGVTKIEILKIAVAFKKLVETIMNKHFTAKKDSTRWKPIHELRLSKFTGDSLPAA